MESWAISLVLAKAEKVNRDCTNSPISSKSSRAKSEEAFATNGEKTAWSDRRPGKKFFAHHCLVHGNKTKVVRAQINSASTCNTMPKVCYESCLPALNLRRQRPQSARMEIRLRPKGQVTLCCERKGKLHILEFLQCFSKS